MMVTDQMLVTSVFSKSQEALGNNGALILTGRLPEIIQVDLYLYLRTEIL